MNKSDKLELQSLLKEKSENPFSSRVHFAHAITRRKKYVYKEEAGLKRILCLHDLIFLGLGSMLGMGVYIMAGDLATKIGPAMILSFMFAGLACALAALCYAEFASRAPGTGSAYSYCYMTVGEFVAFILGWNLCLEFVIGTAYLVRGMSAYIDSIYSGSIAKWEKKHLGMHFRFLADYMDFLSFVLILIFSGIASIGVKESSMITNAFVIMNLVTIFALVVIGLVHANINNWFLSETISPDAGKGGFMPYGFSKVMEGAATCFNAYTGFDTVATTGGEATNPQRTVPIALITCISLAILVYGSISATLTLMWPYFDQNLSKGCPYAYVLEQLGLKSIKVVVTLGVLAAVTGCTLSSLFGSARIVYSIAEDGLLFHSFSEINRITKTPINATIASSMFAGFWSIFFSTEQLLDMASIGTLMAYTMVAICVLLLRYEEESSKTELSSRNNLESDDSSLKKVLYNQSAHGEPNEETSRTVKHAIFFLILVSVILGFILAFGIKQLMVSEPLIIFSTLTLAVIMIITLAVIARQPQSKKELKFKVTPIPYLPALSVFINIYLMLKLNFETWIRFGIWLIIGLLLYFLYGIGHSKEQEARKVISSNKSGSYE